MDSEQGGKPLKTIADLIEEQMQKQARQGSGAAGDAEMEDGEGGGAAMEELDEQIVEVRGLAQEQCTFL